MESTLVSGANSIPWSTEEIHGQCGNLEPLDQKPSVLFQQKWERLMDALKIIRLVALALAVIAAFVEIPYVALAFIVLGLVIGFMGVPEERRLLFLVMAVTLAMVADALNPVPAIGEYLTAILTNASTVLNAGAVAVILMIFKDRLTE
jgi:hypothetical protein